MPVSSGFIFTFVTPEKLILDKETVEEIICPSSKGELNILPGHAPLIAVLKPGTVSFKKQNEWNKRVVSWGFLEVRPDEVRVLAEDAETGVEVSKLQAQKRIDELNHKLKDQHLSPEEIRQVLDEIGKEQARISISQT